MVEAWCVACQSSDETCLNSDLHRAKGFHRWRSDFYLGGRNGTRIRKIHKLGITKKDAEKYEHITVGDYERGKYIPTAKKAILFSELCDKVYREHYLETTRNPHLHTKYRIEKAKNYFGNRIARDIKRQDLKDLRTKLREEGLAAATINRFFNDIKALFYKGMEWELVDSNPCEFITKLEEEDPVPQFATQDEINKIRRAAQNLNVRRNKEVVRQRLLDFMTILLHTGARPISIKSCRWENGDVDFASRNIWFTTWKGRKKYRYPHPIDDVLAELLLRRASVTGKKGPVFDTIDVCRLGTRAIKASGVNKDRPKELKFSLYGLKHCYASHLLMNGATLDEVRRLLGHTDMKMVMKHYGHLTQDYLAKVQNKVNLTPYMEPTDEQPTIDSERRTGSDHGA